MYEYCTSQHCFAQNSLIFKKFYFLVLQEKLFLPHVNLNSVIYMPQQDEKCRKSFESTVISQQTQACFWTIKWRRRTYLNSSRSMGDGKKWMLTKLARPTAGNPHARNLGRKENPSILTHVQEEGRKGMESGGVLCKISVLIIQPTGRQSRLTICQSLPWRGVAQLLPEMVLLSCSASALNSSVSRWMILPLIQPNTRDFFCWVVFVVVHNCHRQSPVTCGVSSFADSSIFKAFLHPTLAECWTICYLQAHTQSWWGCCTHQTVRVHINQPSRHELSHCHLCCRATQTKSNSSAAPFYQFNQGGINHFYETQNS